MKSRSLPRPNGLSFFVALFWLGGTALPALANWPGGTNGSSVPVTLTNSGGNATMANGIVSIVCQTSAAQINQINYTYNNSGQTTTTQLLNGGYDGGKFYWETGGFSSGTFTYTPVAAGPQYGEMDCVSTSTSQRDPGHPFLHAPGFPRLLRHGDLEPPQRGRRHEHGRNAGQHLRRQHVQLDVRGLPAQQVDGGLRRLRHRRVRRSGGGLYLDQRHLRRTVRGQIQIQRRLRRATGLGLGQRQCRHRQRRDQCRPVECPC